MNKYDNLQNHLIIRINKRLKNLLIITIVFLFALNSVSAQIKFNRNIPEEAQEKINQIQLKKINSFSFSPNGGWVIVTESNETFARNIPNECFLKIKELKGKGHKIQQISFPPKGGSNSWIIITDKTTFARNIPEECNKEIQALEKRGKKIMNVSFPYKNPFTNSNNSWVVITTDGATYSRNIPDDCYQIIQNLGQSSLPNKKATRKVTQVSFTPSGGWVVFAEDYFFARNIPDEAFKTLKDFNSKKYKPHLIAFTPNGKGWSLIANDKYIITPKDLIRKIEDNVGGKSIWEFMRDNNVPGVSIAVVINGKTAWETSYGYLKNGDNKYAVHPESMFQVASISKFITAIGAYRMLEIYNSINLDDNLTDPNSMLSVTLPVEKSLDKAPIVSIRTILEHKSGINTHGFAGYATAVNRVPGLDEIIQKKSVSGHDPVNSEKIKIIYDGKDYHYSGGAFTILQKLMEDVTKKPYSDWMKAEVLNPMTMYESRYTINPEKVYKESQLTSGTLSENGKTVRNRYPEYAAAGLYTSARELANVLKMLTNDGVYNNITIINSTNLGLLEKGVGAAANNLATSKTNHYGHGGTNRGYKSLLIVFPDINTKEIRNSGIVIMTNGSSSIRVELANAIIKAYNW